jgi:hypothetical protein
VYGDQSEPELKVPVVSIDLGPSMLFTQKTVYNATNG